MPKKMLKQNTHTKEVHGEKTSCSYLSERDERKKEKKTVAVAKLRNIFGVNRDKQFGQPRAPCH